MHYSGRKEGIFLVGLVEGEGLFYLRRLGFAFFFFFFVDCVSHFSKSFLFEISSSYVS